MRFLNPEFLLLLALLPLLAFLWGKRGPRRALSFSNTAALAALSKQPKVSPKKWAIALRLLALTCVVIALARPQLGNTTNEIKASGVDILLAVDVSGSMEAMDFTLQGKKANRLQVVQSVLEDFVEDRPNDRIGLIAFAGKPYVVCPPTLDHDWLNARLQSLKTGIIKEQGTAIGSAIGSSVNRLKEIQSKSKIIILLTDGMNNAGKIPPKIAATAAKQYDIKIYTIGAGTRGEAQMPRPDVFGRMRYMMVKVDIDEKMLTEVAEETGGTYFRATDTASLTEVYDEINAMETTTRSIKKIEDYSDLFWLFISLALTTLVLESFYRKMRNI